MVELAAVPVGYAGVDGMGARRPWRRPRPRGSVSRSVRRQRGVPGNGPRARPTNPVEPEGTRTQPGLYFALLWHMTTITILRALSANDYITTSFTQIRPHMTGRFICSIGALVAWRAGQHGYHLPSLSGDAMGMSWPYDGANAFVVLLSSGPVAEHAERELFVLWGATSAVGTLRLCAVLLHAQ